MYIRYKSIDILIFKGKVVFMKLCQNPQQKDCYFYTVTINAYDWVRILKTQTK